MVEALGKQNLPEPRQMRKMLGEGEEEMAGYKGERGTAFAFCEGKPASWEGNIWGDGGVE